MPNDAAAPAHRIERVLGVMAATLILLGALAIIGIFISRLAGAEPTLGSPLAVLYLAPIPALGLGVLLVIAFIIVNGVRRSREAQGPGNGRR